MPDFSFLNAVAVLICPPPLWLPDGHSQTIVPALFGRRALRGWNVWQRTRWDTPDGDFIDLDWRVPATTQPSASLSIPPPLLVLFHGLEGSSASHYALAFARCATAVGWEMVVPHFRGCSGEINHMPRAYHSGDHAEIDWILKRLKADQPARPIVAVGVSLGGNALARWAGEHEAAAALTVQALAAVCAPLDLTASGHAIGRGLNRQVYTRMFLNTMRPKALQKWEQYPALFSRDAVLAARDLHDFDNVFTAPLHGFQHTTDYWQQASAKPLLRNIRIPALLLNALNDPFVPASSLPGAHDVSPHVTLWQPQHGGHVGFPLRTQSGYSTGDWLLAMPQSVVRWLMGHLDGEYATNTGERDG